MSDDDFLNELEELTKNMTKEFAAEKDKSTSGQNNTGQTRINGANDNSSNFPNDFGMKFDGSEADIMKELEKMLGGLGGLGGLSGLTGMDMNLDDSDPQTKEMMKLLNDNIKDLEVKMNEMQKNIVNQPSNSVSDIKTEITKDNLISSDSNKIPLKQESEINIIKDLNESNVNQQNKNFNSSNLNNNQKPQSSNPFVDTFREMKENPQNGGFNDLLKLFEQSGMNSQDANFENLGDMGDIKNLYEILGKLSDNKDDKETPQSGDEKIKLESLFGDLLEFLLKSDMLSEPLNQIKTSVNNYLEKNKEKLKPEEEEKYKSMLTSIDTILEEIQKKEPNKELVIEIFYKLHEMSDIDSEILPQGDNTFKQFSDLFSGHK